jgi:hypothetical protein
MWRLYAIWRWLRTTWSRTCVRENTLDVATELEAYDGQAIGRAPDRGQVLAPTDGAWAVFRVLLFLFLLRNFVMFFFRCSVFIAL